MKMVLAARIGKVTLHFQHAPHLIIADSCMTVGLDTPPAHDELDTAE